MATSPSSGSTPSGTSNDAPPAEHGTLVLPPRDVSSLREPSRLSRIWQFPLLVGSLALFAYAGYRLIDPKAGPTIDDRLTTADLLLTRERGEDAAELLRKLLTETGKEMSPEQRGRLHLMLARSIEQVQKARRLDLPQNHKRIIEFTTIAERGGVKLDAAAHRRVAESHEALGKPADAVAAYRRVLSADPSLTSVRRKVLDLVIASDDTALLQSELKAYLDDPNLPRSERAWALGEQSRVLVDRGLFGDAKSLLNEALRSEPEQALLGQLNYRLGYCHYKLGDIAEAERHLRLARDQLTTSHPQDADAALLLGQLLQMQRRHAEAISFFQAVLVSHPEEAPAVLAKMGRGVSRIELKEDDAGLSDLQSATQEVTTKPARVKYRGEALSAIRRASLSLADRDHLAGALELMSLEQGLEPTPSADFFGRLSGIYERRAGQITRAADAMPDGADRSRRQQQARELLTKAADAAIAQSRGLTVDDDRGYGQALWRGIDLYDRAGSIAPAIGALELFIAERPDDPATPDALLRLGRSFHASGRFDKAIEAFQRNQFRYGQTLAASKSGVPMARAFLAKGPAFYGKAESALKATLESPLLTPDADEFREALFTLAELYTRTGRYVEAVHRLEEMTARYPADRRRGQLLFLMADSYRKSAADVKQPAPKPTQASPMDTNASARLVTQEAERQAAYRDRLDRARGLFEQVVEHYQANGIAGDIDGLYFRLAHFYRADCAYDLGSLDDAIQLYGVAARKYQDDPSSLGAYVQIINAHAALGRAEEARAANERLRVLLAQMPASAFAEAQRTMPQVSWEKWTMWTRGVSP